jgi:hypothetical protein
VGPVDIQLVTYAPTVFYHCQHCEIAFHNTPIGERVHREQALAALPDDLRADYGAALEWVHDVVDRHGDLVSINVVDAASIEGVWKSLRYRLGRYPAVVINGSKRQVTDDFRELDPLIDECVATLGQGGGA